MRTYICIECSGEFEAPHARGVLPVWCPECYKPHRKRLDREKALRWRNKDPEKARELARLSYKRSRTPEVLRVKRERAVRHKYGIEPEELAALERAQEGLCAICHGARNGPGKRLHIDHCHETNKIRGLLCAKCNTMLGLANHDSAVLLAAASYLKED